MFEVVDKHGSVYGPFRKIDEAVACAERNWPNEELDEDGNTYDCRAVR
jgi:hypothetical protein